MGRLVETADDLGGLKVQAASLPGVDGKALRGVWDGLRKGGVDVGRRDRRGRRQGAAARRPVARRRWRAGSTRGRCCGAASERARRAAAAVGPSMAQGQGQDAARAEEALAKVRALLAGSLA